VSLHGVAPLARVYAEALGQAADTRGGEDLVREIGDALLALGKAWAEDEALRAYFLSALVKAGPREDALERWLAPLPPLLGDFVRVLFRHGRGEVLAAAAEAYRSWMDQRLGRVPVRLATATSVDPGRLEAWTARLREVLGKEPILRHVVDPDLIAGATLRVGDVVVDGSARRQLRELERHVQERGTHALQA